MNRCARMPVCAVGTACCRPAPGTICTRNELQATLATITRRVRVACRWLSHSAPPPAPARDQQAQAAVADALLRSSACRMPHPASLYVSSCPPSRHSCCDSHCCRTERAQSVCVYPGVTVQCPIKALATRRHRPRASHLCANPCVLLRLCTHARGAEGPRCTESRAASSLHMMYCRRLQCMAVQTLCLPVS